MPAAFPIRERVAIAMAEALVTIATGTIYWTSPTVTRSLLSISHYERQEDFPILGVVRSSGSVLEPAQRPMGFRAQYLLSVIGYVWGSDTVLAGSQLERLWADHVACLLSPAHRSLGGLVTGLAPVGPCDTDDGELEPKAVFRQDWSMILHESFAS